MNGGIGNDTVAGDAGNDAIVGGDGNDALSGGDGNDKLLGDAGNDTIEGGDGNDFLHGGAGDDVITDSVRATMCGVITCTPVTGLMPRLASVAAITAISRAVTRMAHCRK